MSALLALENVSAGYGAVQALSDVSLQVEQGEIVTLIGANGAGKSTLLMTICGEPRARAGRILLGGEEITGLATHAIMRRGLAQAPEGRRVFARMSVAENLVMGAEALGRPADRLEEVLALFPRLAERIGQRAGTLSGGEQQMVAMARAMMGRPRLICMDEPTMGLSPRFVDVVLELIATINREGTTIFMVEQNASLALQIAHRGYVLQTGRIALEGAARALAADPRIRDAYLGGEAA